MKTPTTDRFSERLSNKVCARKSVLCFVYTSVVDLLHQLQPTIYAGSSGSGTSDKVTIRSRDGFKRTPPLNPMSSLFPADVITVLALHPAVDMSSPALESTGSELMRGVAGHSVTRSLLAAAVPVKEFVSVCIVIAVFHTLHTNAIKLLRFEMANSRVVLRCLVVAAVPRRHLPRPVTSCVFRRQFIVIRVAFYAFVFVNSAQSLMGVRGSPAR